MENTASVFRVVNQVNFNNPEDKGIRVTFIESEHTPSVKNASLQVSSNSVLGSSSIGRNAMSCN